MTKNRSIFIGIIALLIIAGGAYFWANAQMEGLYNYRSLLRDAPPEPAQPFEWAENEPLTERVVFILVDALRNDTAHNTTLMPYLNELRAQGAWATSHSQEPSYSAPGYSTIAIGAWPHLNDGPVFNLAYEDIPTWTQDNIFSAAHRAGLKTAVSGYNWFEKLIPQNAVDASFYTPEYDAAADMAVMDAALPWLTSDDYQFVFIHLDQVDTAGHLYGADSPEWDAAATQVDAHIREIVSHLNLGQDTVLITSDHGQINAGGHGGPEPVVLTEPFVLVGAGVTPGEHPDILMIDIAPTLSVLLGANIPATAQGAVLTDMLTLTPEQKTTVNAALDAQKRILHKTYVEIIGEDLPIREDMGVVTGTNFAIDAMLLTQIDKFRRMRLNTPMLLIIVSLYLLFRERENIKYEAIGAVAYTVIYHLYYLLIAGRTYSFSSINGENALIIFNLITAVILLSTVWFVMMQKNKTFTKGKKEAVQSTLKLIGLTLYLWLIPVLWNYGVNGFTPTWHLPNFQAFFMGILALIQIICISAVGILLTGVAALVAKKAST